MPTQTTNPGCEAVPTKVRSAPCPEPKANASDWPPLARAANRHEAWKRCIAHHDALDVLYAENPRYFDGFGPVQKCVVPPYPEWDIPGCFVPSGLPYFDAEKVAARREIPQHEKDYRQAMDVVDAIQRGDEGMVQRVLDAAAAASPEAAPSQPAATGNKKKEVRPSQKKRRAERQAEYVKKGSQGQGKNAPAGGRKNARNAKRAAGADQLAAAVADLNAQAAGAADAARELREERREVMGPVQGPVNADGEAPVAVPPADHAERVVAEGDDPIGAVEDFFEDIQDRDDVVGDGLRTAMFAYDLPLPSGWLPLMCFIISMVCLLFPVGQIFWHVLATYGGERVASWNAMYAEFLHVRDRKFDVCDFAWLAPLPDGSTNWRWCWLEDKLKDVLSVIMSLLKLLIGLGLVVSIVTLMYVFRIIFRYRALFVWAWRVFARICGLRFILGSIIVPGVICAATLLWWTIERVNGQVRRTDWELFTELFLEPFLNGERVEWLRLSFLVAEYATHWTIALWPFVKLWMALVVGRYAIIRIWSAAGLWQAALFYEFEVHTTTLTDADHRVATARSTPLLMPSRVGVVTLSRSRRFCFLHTILSGFLPRRDEVEVDIGHLLTALSHRVDLPSLSDADQVKRIQESARALDLFNIPERLSLNDFHGNATFVAWEIIYARRQQRAQRRPTGF